MSTAAQFLSQDSATTDELAGIVAEYENVDDLLSASKLVRDEGYRKWDTFTPFPVHGIERSMGIRRTILPFIVFGGGLTGVLGGILMQWWMNASDYALLISGKPLWSLPANIPVAFECTILLSALSAFFGMLALNNLPTFFHPLDRVPRFRRVTTDRFFVYIEAKDPRFDAERTRKLLEGTGSRYVEDVRK